MSANKWAERVGKLSDAEVLDLFFNWAVWARPEQWPPEGDWTTWLLMGGRGAGKTRAGAEWVRALASCAVPVSPIALVSESLVEARRVMIEGPSGLLSVGPPGERPTFERGRQKLVWPNGAEAHLMSASDPERFRGPQFAAAWCDELGCGAVDKGANQPNIFGDSKSSEDGRPYFSAGTPDALIQRQFLRAHHRHWQPGEPGFDEANNPVSVVYGGRMVNPNRIFCWTWDARPFPAFPQRTNVWSDGPNHRIGHWLTSRLGGAASDELIKAMAAHFAVPVHSVSANGMLISGAQVSAVTTMRAATSALWDAAALSIKDTPDGLVFMSDSDGGRVDVLRDDCAAADGVIIKRTRPNADEVPGQLSLAYFDRNNDYQSASSVAVSGTSPHQVSAASNLVLNAQTARSAAENNLRRRAATETISFGLPPSRQALEPGDKLYLAEVNDGPFAIETVRAGAALDLSGRVLRDPLIASFDGEDRTSPPQVPQAATEPELLLAHLPGAAGDVAPTRLLAAVYADPWPGPIRLTREGLGTELVRLHAAGTIGELTAALPAASTHLWDLSNSISAQLYNGHLSSVSDAQTLLGANRMAIQHDDSSWEIVGFAEAVLGEPNHYILSRLLRGREGTDHALAAPASAGNPIALLNGTVAQTPMTLGDIGGSLLLKRFAGPLDILGHDIAIELDLAPALPLAPAGLSAHRTTGSADIAMNWLRRSRVGGDGWAPANVPLDYTPEAYRVQIMNDAEMVRETNVATGSFAYSAAMQITDFGSIPTSFSFTIQQLSAVLGPGHAATGAFHG